MSPAETTAQSEGVPHPPTLVHCAMVTYDFHSVSLARAHARALSMALFSDHSDLANLHLRL